MSVAISTTSPIIIAHRGASGYRPEHTFELSKLRRRGAACRQTSPTSLVTDAHVAGLLVHVWTFRNEDCFLPLDFQGNPEGEYELERIAGK